MKFSSDEVLSPSEWVQILRERGILVSERKLRSLARKHQQFYSLGQTMLLHPMHIDVIMSAEAKQNARKM